MARIEQLDDAVPAAENWIGALLDRLAWRDRQKGFLALMATLHALRDYLPPDEAMYLGAQLPPLLRGFYYEGWHLAGRPLSIENRSEFLERIQDGVHRDPGIDAEVVARAVLALLAERLPAGELEDAKAATPRPLRTLWPS